MSRNRKPDFLREDFFWRDFEVRARSVITDWFFRRLPTWYKREDTYKDKEGRGLLERYLSAFDPEVLEYIYPDIEYFLDIIDAQTCEPKFLTHISDVLGNPPDIFNNEDKYRNLLTYIISIYKIKGTKESYKLFFDILGFDVEIYEVPLTNNTSRYDIGGEYDSDEFEMLYDQNNCPTCSYYDIILYPKDNTTYNIDSGILKNIKETLIFNEPINAKLRYLVIGLNIVDSMEVIVEENDIELLSIQGSIYDNQNEYDDGNIYEP